VPLCGNCSRQLRQLDRSIWLDNYVPVNPIVERHKEAIAEACRAFGVERLELFGSASRGDFEPSRSDIDFIVTFQSPGAAGYADRYLALAEALERIFERPVDLVTERSLRNPLLLQMIDRDRVSLYAA
jgi:hypothetical protein